MQEVYYSYANLGKVSLKKMSQYKKLYELKEASDTIKKK